MAISKQRKILGDSIRIFRKKAGLTQEKLAELADLHRNYIGEVERGEKTVSVDALLRIAAAVKVPLRRIVADL